LVLHRAPGIELSPRLRLGLCTSRSRWNAHPSLCGSTSLRFDTVRGEICHVGNFWRRPWREVGTVTLRVTWPIRSIDSQSRSIEPKNLKLSVFAAKSLLVTCDRFLMTRSHSIISARERHDGPLLSILTMEIDEGKLFSCITRVFLERDKSNSKTLKRTSWEEQDPRQRLKTLKSS
jgi:hypothetical protein